jgi:hypothetical protein
MAGRVVGKAAGLYLVQREGAEHMELLDLDDLRSAKFFDARIETGTESAHIAAAEAIASATTAPEPEMADQGSQRRRLSDQIRRQLGRP